MKLNEVLKRWGLSALRITTPFLEAEFSPKDADRKAAWDLYVELLTRVATQPLDPEHGDEKTALDSVQSLFPTTRQVLKDNSRDCVEFAKIAVIVLNQIVRPFTAKWHQKSLAGAFGSSEGRAEFRTELVALQEDLRRYSQLLAEMAGVEDLTSIQREDSLK